MLFLIVFIVYVLKDFDMKYMYFNLLKEFFLKIGMNYLLVWYFDIEV